MPDLLGTSDAHCKEWFHGSLLKPGTGQDSAGISRPVPVVIFFGAQFSRELARYMNIHIAHAQYMPVTKLCTLL